MWCHWLQLAGSPDPTWRLRKSNPGAILGGAKSPRLTYLGSILINFSFMQYIPTSHIYQDMAVAAIWLQLKWHQGWTFWPFKLDLVTLQVGASDTPSKNRNCSVFLPKQKNDILSATVLVFKIVRTTIFFLFLHCTFISLVQTLNICEIYLLVVLPVI